MTLFWERGRYQRLSCTQYSSPAHIPAAGYTSWESRFGLLTCSVCKVWLSCSCHVPNDQSMITTTPNDQSLNTTAPNNQSLNTSAPNHQSLIATAPNHQSLITTASNDQSLISPNYQSLNTTVPNDQTLITNAPTTNHWSLLPPTTNHWSAPNNQSLITHAPLFLFQTLFLFRITTKTVFLHVHLSTTAYYFVLFLFLIE